MNNWSVIFLSLLLSAFFSGMEIAFVTANKLRLGLQKKRGIFSARLLSPLLDKPRRFIVTMLVGNNVALVIFSIAMANKFAPLFHRVTDWEFAVFIMQTVTATAIVLLAGEFFPKNLFRLNPNGFLHLFAIPAWFIYHILYPVVFLFQWFSETFLRRLFRVKFTAVYPALGKTDLSQFIRENTGNLPSKIRLEPEVRIFQNALGFSQKRLRECMIPRTEIIALEAGETVERLRECFIRSGHSRILIYKGNIDQVIGYTHSHELLKSPKEIQAILLPISFVPESMKAGEMLRKFIRQKRSIAVVVDEFGGTAGLVTMEDVMEEIFGEIMDEYDEAGPLEKKLGEGEYLFSGRLEIDYLNGKYKLGLPASEEYETLAGLITHRCERIPGKEERVEIGHCLLTIADAASQRIRRVHLKILEREAK